MSRFPKPVIKIGLILTICFGFSGAAIAGSCRPTHSSQSLVDSLLNGKADLETMPDRIQAEALMERLLVRTRGMELSESQGEPRSSEVEAANQWIKKITESWVAQGEGVLPGKASFVWLP